MVELKSFQFRPEKVNRKPNLKGTKNIPNRINFFIYCVCVLGGPFVQSLRHANLDQLAKQRENK